MTYAIKEIYYTLQGEGAHTGRPAVFCRFSGCNLWSGKESDRHTAICQFCDTDFVGTDGSNGGKYRTPFEVAQLIDGCWPKDEIDQWKSQKFVVFTGGEPLLQLDKALVDSLHDMCFSVAIETNGTKLPPEGIDWICVSPKANAPLLLTAGNELKLVFPQEGASPENYEKLNFEHFFLQPMDGPNQRANIELAAKYCMLHPRWELSLQTHKLIGLR